MVRLKFAVFLGWKNDQSLVDRIVKFVKPVIEKDHDLIIIDVPQPIPTCTTPAEHPTNVASQVAHSQEQIDISSVDGFIFVSTEYYGCIPSSLASTLFHYKREAFWFKPCALVVYFEDLYSTARAAKLLRSICGELGCGSVKKICAIPEVQEKLDENGTPASENMKNRLEKNLKQLLDQLYWTAHAFKDYTTAHPPPASLTAQ